MGIIYMATNKVNGKKYVGQTWQTLGTRRSQHHCKPAKSSYAFGQAILKYGKASFDWVVLHDGIESQEEMDSLEAEEIIRNNSLVPNGYNIRMGGNGGKIEVLSSYNVARSVLVSCIETGTTYETIREAGRIIGITSPNISACLKNPARTAHGLHFRYANDEAYAKVLEDYETRQRERIDAIAKQKEETKTRARQRNSKWDTEWHNEVLARKMAAQERRDTKMMLIEKLGKQEYDKMIRERAREASIALLHNEEYQRRFRDGMLKRSRHPMRAS